MTTVRTLAAAVLLAACARDGASGAPAPSADLAPAASASATASSNHTPVPAASAAPAPETGWRITRLRRTSSGEWEAQLPDSRHARAVFGTTAAPRAARGPLVLSRLGEALAPGLVAETRLRSVPLSEVMTAVEGDVNRAHLKRELRVLGDGTVEVAIVVRPESRKTVDLANVAQGSTAWSLDSHLVSRDAIPPDRTALLAAYQKVLALDHLAGNLARRYVVQSGAEGLVAAEGNEAFSTSGTEGALTDAFARLARSLTYSRSLLDGLRRLDATHIEGAARGSRPGDRAFTPRQAQEVGERRDAIIAVIEQRRRQRGDKALGLP